MASATRGNEEKRITDLMSQMESRLESRLESRIEAVMKANMEVLRAQCEEMIKSIAMAAKLQPTPKPETEVVGEGAMVQKYNSPENFPSETKGYLVQNSKEETEELDGCSDEKTSRKSYKVNDVNSEPCIWSFSLELEDYPRVENYEEESKEFGAGDLVEHENYMKSNEQNQRKFVLPPVCENAKLKKLVLSLPTPVICNFAPKWLSDWDHKPKVKMKLMAQHDEKLGYKGNVQWVSATAKEDWIQGGILEELQAADSGTAHVREISHFLMSPQMIDNIWKANKEEMAMEFERMSKVVKDVLGGKVEKVNVFDRVVDSPCHLVIEVHGWAANMERVWTTDKCKAAAVSGWIEIFGIQMSKEVELSAQLRDIARWLLQSYGGSNGLSIDSPMEAGYSHATVLGDVADGMADVDARARRRLDHDMVRGVEWEQNVAAILNFKACSQAKKLMETEHFANTRRNAQLRELATILSVIRNLKRLLVKFPKPMVKMRLVLFSFWEMLRAADMLGVLRRKAVCQGAAHAWEFGARTSRDCIYGSKQAVDHLSRSAGKIKHGNLSP